MSIDLSPGSPEWCRRVSPSKAAAILGISPWDSQRAVWHKMRGEVPWDEENEAMERGNLLEAGVLGWWVKRHPEHGAWAEQVSYVLDDWLVATPDAVTTLDGERIIVEAKTASDMGEWGDEGTDALPVYYLTQVYLAAHVANRCGTRVARVHVPVLGPWLRFANYVVEYDAEIGADLERRMREFYDSLSADVPPELDDSLATYEAIRRVHPDIDMDAAVELDAGEAFGLLEAVSELDQAEADERLWKSRVIDRMGRARFATHCGVKVARRQANKSGVSFVPLPKNLPLLEEVSA